MIHYSQTTNAFYDDAIHSEVPTDAVIISAETHQALLNGQSAGKVISPDGKGNPVLVNPPAPTPEQVIVQNNAKARKYLADTDWYIIRKTETGVDVPAEITTARAKARATIVE